ncbi:hypothetical protein C6499_03465 [Candidatus Poribacteria bacterium]|nr:MAG: hypothetical protein C6499_03465 [Candidatus Poribacteria bacterium]
MRNISQLTLSLALCLLLMQPFAGFAVEEFKVSKFGKGKQVWFEAEAFDERDSEDVYKLGKGEKAVDPADGAFGDIITNAGAGKKGWILYRFDISRAGGKAGEWRFIGRLINPSNHSDWLWVLGDDGDKIPDAEPAFARPADIIFEENVPAWTWMRTGDFGQDAGTINELQDGENVMMIWTRQSSLQVQYDVFCWSSDLEYEPTDEDYEKAESKTLPVEPDGLLTTTWGRLKQ